jgi:transcription initiation factor TFIIB
MASLRLECRQHPKAVIVEDFRAGDLICTECGVVVGDRLVDVGSEWRTFNSSEKRDFTADPNRVGQAEDPLFHGTSGLSTVLAKLPGEQRQQGQNRTASTLNRADRSLASAYKEIDHMAGSLNLSQVVSRRAKKLFKETIDSTKLRGRSHDAIGAACIYIACRQEKVAHTFNEICGATRMPKRDISRCYKRIIKALDVSAQSSNPTAEDFLPRFCNKLELPRVVEMAARHINQAVRKVGIVDSKVYTSNAGAIIFMVSQLSEKPASLEDISAVIGVSVQAIKNSYREIFTIAPYLFPKDFVFHERMCNLPDFGPPSDPNPEARAIAAGLTPIKKEEMYGSSKAKAKPLKTEF